jgi:electron transport complex protein RnfB
VDCIIGAPKRMHVVIEDQCTGCELCIPACPVDCIVLEDATPGASGWAAWSQVRAREAQERYAFRRMRIEREQRENDARLADKAAAKLADLSRHSTLTDPLALDQKRAAIEAALARARAKRLPA